MGGACSLTTECQNQKCQVPGGCTDVECCVGVCGAGPVPARDVPIGGVCRSHAECVEGAFCGGACQPRVPAGASCSAALCRWDSVCLTRTTGDGFVCSGFAALGETCVGNVCGAPGAPLGYCDPQDLICKPWPYAEIGEACDAERWCHHGSCRDGVCQARGILNEPCTGLGALPCEQGPWLLQQIECVNGVCSRPPLPPDPCAP